MGGTRDVVATLEGLAVERLEGGGPVPCLSSESIESAAREHALTLRRVSVIALENGIVPLRYVKNIGTLGTAGQARLLRSRVLVVGAGGLGGGAVELLARSGVGTIVLADPDAFEETNLNRQNFCCTDVIGRPKVLVAGERVRYINPEVDVQTRAVAAGRENLPDLLDGCGVAIDALDNLDDRRTLQAACAAAGVVMVHGAIAGTSLQATTVYPGEPGLEGFAPYGGSAGGRGIELETGNPATTPLLCAAIQVQEAVKVLLGEGGTLRGRMLYLDSADWTFELIDL